MFYFNEVWVVAKAMAVLDLSSEPPDTASMMNALPAIEIKRSRGIHGTFDSRIRPSSRGLRHGGS
ncbi:hypothetical protein CCP4SC76_2100008 [Gammaproteobacteria bacterium]